nr:AAA family ATPase [Planomonospora venezuelensis]
MSTLFSELGAVRGRAVEMRVLQYGVTRERLAEILKDGEGWDVVHVSGHGNPGELLLEHPDGSPDPVPAADFVDLLEPTAERLKLVTVSACSSAALKAADQLRALGVTPPAGWSGSASPGPVSPESVSAEHALSTLATDLADRLDCAVLAMRYPVVDSFAIDLAAELYGLLVEKGRPLPRALGMALRAVVAAPPTLDCPALSVTTPALFGARALELKLTAPEGEPVTFRPGSLKLAGLPPQPPRFVGRTKAITDASAALAPRSGAAGVLLYGMPGAGKTACALELAYTHAESFRIVAWHKAPDEGTDTTGAFTAFLTDLERKISGLELVHLAENEEALRAFLPLLTEFFERNRVLVVLDNAESLLTSDGGWRDRRWGPVVDALTGHGGFSRLVVTSRVRPAALEGRVEQIAIDALPAAEALLLARELPGLRALMDGRTRGVEPSDARELAVRAVKMAHGHPKLLELADGQAADSGRLRGLLEAGGAAWRETAGGLPEDFFTVVDRAAGVSGEDYLRVLERWTQVVAGGLSAAERDLFGFVCCLEEDDRLGFVLEAVWPVLWRRLGREGAVPEPEAVLGVLVRRGLASPEAGGRLGVHPGVATAGRAAAGQVFRAAVDAELAAFWQAIFDQAVEGQGGQELGEWVVRAGLGAVPYLLRRHAWAQAGWLLGRVLYRDDSRAVAVVALPALRRIAAAVRGGPGEAGTVFTLAWALQVVDASAAEAQLRELAERARAAEDDRTVSVALGELVKLCLGSGRLGEALELAEQKIAASRRAGWGPWTLLADEGRRVQVLAAMGKSEQALAEVERLWEQMAALPARAGADEVVEAWNVRELLLSVGRDAAARLGAWERALAFSDEMLASMRARGAAGTEMARSRFNDYFPLLRLDRIEQAWQLLAGCREVFERHQDGQGLGKVLSALADVEDARGHGDRAIGLERDALRYKYAARDVAALAVSHHNLGNYLTWQAGQVAAGLAHHLAAALVCAVIGGEGLEDSLWAAEHDLRQLPDPAQVPADVAALCRLVEEVPGVRLADLLAALADPGTLRHTYDQIIEAVTTAAGSPG